ncbi:hypothetical protein LJR267_009218 [Paraburkholderia hospita]|jgi:hypothetical protein|uniref:hypothetical protein n=1 Tax=Paraburkholderia hospita TaxID=169430 RepID=UPI003ECDC011
MVQIPPQVRLQRIDRGAQTAQRARQRLTLRGCSELWQALAQPADDREQLAQLAGTLPFGTVAQARIGALLVARLP